jgi:tetratricopeptide (TPR) repeat protein
MVLFRPTVGLVILVLTLASCAPAQTVDAEPIASALQNQDYAKALELVRSALQSSPRDARLWTMQGVAYAGQGDKKQALASFDHALKIAPDYLPALHQAIQIHFDEGNPAAIPLLERVLRLQPADQTSHAMLAVLGYQQGNCAAAVTHFAKSGRLLDSQLDSLHAYATCLVRLKQFDPAIDVFERAVALEPSSAQERKLLASIQLMAHKPHDATATLDPLVQSSPTADILQLAADAYEESGDTDKAVSALRQAILLNPRDPGPYVDFAYISSAHQSFQVGVNILNDGIGQVPDSAQLYFARGVLYVQIADYEKATADFDKAYELDPHQSLTAAAQSLLAVQENDPDRALASVEERLKRKPNDSILLYLRADILAQKGVESGTPQFQLALGSAKKSVALNPSLGPAHEVLAKLYMQAGQNDLAIEQTRKSLEIDPKNQASVYRLIQLLRKTGKHEQIPTLLTRLAELRREEAQNQHQRDAYRLVEGRAQ